MAIVNGYCELEELTQWNQATSTVDVGVLERAITACSRAIDNFCDRTFWQVTEARVFDACGSYAVDIDDLVSITSVKTDDNLDGTHETTWAAADYQLLPLRPRSGWPYTKLQATGTRTLPSHTDAQRHGLIEITGTWGWPEVPVDVKQACLLLSARIFSRRESPQGVAGWGDFGMIRVNAEDRDATALLTPYQLYPIGFA
jgi:hypothetical protein